MPPRTISFPPLHMGLRQGGMVLSLQTSVALELPDSLPHIHSYSELLNAIQDDHLWIARHGSSYFVVNLTKELSNLSALERVMAADWIESHEIWNRLGLRIVSSNTEYDPAKISWSIQHPDLTSILAAPRQALTAEFREVRCTIELKAQSQERQTAKSSKKQKVKQEEIQSPRTSTQEAGTTNDGYIQEEKYDALDPDGQRMVDEMLGSCSAELKGDGTTTGKRRGPSTSGNLLPLEDFRVLVEGALEIALFGSSKRLTGIKPLRDANVQGLTLLLPGVFHMPHLKAVGERASFLPVLATSLARMTNAESPSLRRKANDFQYGLTRLDMDTAPSEKVIQGIEKATWCTLLKHVKPPSSRSRNSARAVHWLATPVSTTRESLGEPTLVFGEMFASQVSPSSSLQLGTPAVEVERERTLSRGTPFSAPEASAQGVTRSTSTLLQSSLTSAGLSALPSPVSTPTLQIFGSPQVNSPTHPHFNQASFGVSIPHETPVLNLQFQQGMPIVTNKNPHCPMATQNQNYYLTGYQDHNIDNIGSQNPDLGMEASQQDMSLGSPADFASFEDFLGGASTADFSFGP